MSLSVTVVDSHREALEASGLLEGTRVFDGQFDSVKATLKTRQTLRAGDFYIKRYLVDVETSKRWFAASFASMAEREWAVLHRLAEADIPSIEPAALIHDTEGGQIKRACLITRALPDTETLEEADRTPAQRRTLATRVGEMLRDMHDAGVNHRDCYLVHWRVTDEDRLFITDLNRADIRGRVGRRWRVKDLAALLFSAQGHTTTTERARAFKAYLGGRPLRKFAGLMRAVERKAARMARHTQRKVSRGVPNYHMPDRIAGENAGSSG